MKAVVVIPIGPHHDRLARRAVDSVPRDEGEVIVHAMDDGITSSPGEYGDAFMHACSPAGGPTFARGRILNLLVGWGGTRLVGDWDACFFLDADDEYLPGKIERSLREIGRGAALVYTDEYYADEVTGKRHHRYREPYSPAAALRSNVFGGSYCVSREALTRAGNLDRDLAIGEMYDLALRIAKIGPVVHVAEPLVRVNLGPDSLFHRTPRTEWAATMVRIQETHRDLRPQAS